MENVARARKNSRPICGRAIQCAMEHHSKTDTSGTNTTDHSQRKTSSVKNHKVVTQNSSIVLA